MPISLSVGGSTPLTIEFGSYYHEEMFISYYVFHLTYFPLVSDTITRHGLFHFSWSIRLERTLGRSHC